MTATPDAHVAPETAASRKGFLFLPFELLASMTFALAMIQGCPGDGAGQDVPAQAAVSAPVAAAEPHPSAPMTLPAEYTVPDTRLELRRGALAPFDGILFDPPTLVRWVNRIEWLQARLHLEHDLHVQLEEATRSSYQQLTAQLTDSYERELEADRRILEDTQAALDRAQRRITALERHPPHRAFAIGAGLGAGLVLSAGIVGAVLAH